MVTINSPPELEKGKELTEWKKNNKLAVLWFKTKQRYTKIGKISSSNPNW